MKRPHALQHPLYQDIATRRNNKDLSKNDHALIRKICKEVQKANKDNISRTVFYQKFYNKHPEIKWALLASLVSRNAGWNMTDLVGRWYSSIISEKYRDLLFLTYERANWLIFDDAYPQLLIYEASKASGRPLFYLLQAFHVSAFMEREWERFWKQNEEKRLCTALIINEQNIIQKPVIQDSFYKKKVFQSIPFRIQDWFHFNTVIFPTENGELYGFSVYDFRNLKDRIRLGKRLQWLLFESKESSLFHNFAFEYEHTGSRFDYERFLQTRNKRRNTPFLRAVYPIIKHHRSHTEDWSRADKFAYNHFQPLHIPKPYNVTSWYKKKQKQLHAAVLLHELLFPE